MKKIIKIAMALVGSVLALPLAVLAAAGDTTPTDGLDPIYITSSFATLQSLFITAVLVLIGFAVVWFTWNVIKYVMSADEKGKEQAKSQMVWGIVALAVILSIWGFVNILRVLFKVNDTTSNVPTNLNTTMIPQ